MPTQQQPQWQPQGQPQPQWQPQQPQQMQVPPQPQNATFSQPVPQAWNPAPEPPKKKSKKPIIAIAAVLIAIAAVLIVVVLGVVIFNVVAPHVEASQTAYSKFIDTKKYDLKDPELNLEQDHEFKLKVSSGVKLDAEKTPTTRAALSFSTPNTSRFMPTRALPTRFRAR